MQQHVALKSSNKKHKGQDKNLREADLFSPGIGMKAN